jgi:hypothetical protein
MCLFAGESKNIDTVVIEERLSKLNANINYVMSKYLQEI